jgi:hypothetical protein
VPGLQASLWCRHRAQALVRFDGGGGLPLPRGGGGGGVGDKWLWLWLWLWEVVLRML